MQEFAVTHPVEHSYHKIFSVSLTSIQNLNEKCLNANKHTCEINENKKLIVIISSGFQYEYLFNIMRLT